ncbi:hypothetical protein CDAR_434132 [Caerostris darwini]|uniref:Uncharacterized protein n=1 Tax=Caerostris darwini TaxID=1538125 RepID=A0AAV4WHW0_9ARAC|nr:hypothetical protein CDAR_434132 [Caerostris darwini]
MGQFKEFSSEQTHKLKDKKFSHDAQRLTDDINPEKIPEEFNNDDFDEELEDMSVPPFPDREKIHRKDTKDHVPTAQSSNSVDKRNEEFANLLKSIDSNKEPEEKLKIMDQDDENVQVALSKNPRSPSEVHRHKLAQLKRNSNEKDEEQPLFTIDHENTHRQNATGKFQESENEQEVLEEPDRNLQKFRDKRRFIMKFPVVTEKGRPGKHRPGQKKLKKGHNSMSNNNNKRKKFNTTKSGRRRGHQHVKKGSGGRHKPHRDNKRLFKKAAVESIFTETAAFEYTTIIDLYSMSNSTLSSEEAKVAFKRQASDVDEGISRICSPVASEHTCSTSASSTRPPPRKKKKRRKEILLESKLRMGKTTRPVPYSENEKMLMTNLRRNDILKKLKRGDYLKNLSTIPLSQGNVSTTELPANITNTEPPTTLAGQKRNIKRQADQVPNHTRYNETSRVLKNSQVKIPNDQNKLRLVKLIYKIQEQQLESIFDSSNSTPAQTSSVLTTPFLVDVVKMQSRMIKNLENIVQEKRPMPVVTNHPRELYGATNPTDKQQPSTLKIIKKEYKSPVVRENPTYNRLQQSFEQMKNLIKKKDLLQVMAEDNKEKTETNAANSFKRSGMEQELMERDLNMNTEVSSTLPPSMLELLGASMVRNADAIEMQQVGEARHEERPNYGEKQNLDAKMHKYFVENSGVNNNDLGSFQSPALNSPGELVDSSAQMLQQLAKLRRTRNSIQDSEDEEVDDSDNLEEATEDSEETEEVSNKNEEAAEVSNENEDAEEQKREADDGNLDSASTDYVENTSILADDPNAEEEDKDYEGSETQPDYDNTEDVADHDDS